jgi:SOUL heme-binding protein
MNQSLIILFILAVLFFISQAFMIRSTGKTEQRPYKVIRKDSQLEIRYYPEAVLASVNMSGGNFREVSYLGFRTLANYIFGGNQGKQQIAMTTPVEMKLSDTASSMSFSMPSNYDLQQLPAPDNSNVQLHKTQAEYVAVVSFSGYATDAKIEKYTNELKALLSARKINYVGPFRFLGYNPPYQVIGRNNEIIVRVDSAQVISL